MTRSSTRRRVARPPQRPVLAKGTARDRLAPGGGPGGGFSSLSLMPEALPGGMGAMARAQGGSTVAAAAPMQANTSEPASEPAEPMVEAAQSDALSAAGDTALAVIGTATAEVMPDMAPPEAANEDDAAGETAAPEMSDMAAPEVAETGATADINLKPVATEAESDAGGEATPPAAAKAEEAPPEPSPAQAVAPATRAVGKRAAKSATHQPAASATDGAIKASNKKSVTQNRMAQDASVKDAEKAKTGKVDTSAFEAVLRRAIAEAIPEPKSEREAKDVIRHGGERAAKKVGVGLQEQKTNAVGELPGKVGEEAVPKATDQPAPEEVPLVPEEAGAPPEPVSAGPMVPPPSTEAAIDTSANRDGVNQLQADNKISKDQLEKGNDPDMTATLTARDAAEKHDREAPKQLREAEAADRANTRGRAHGKIEQGLLGFHGERVARLDKVATAQTNTKGLTETRKQEIADAIQTIADQTRTDVTQILTDMDAKVEEDFRDAIDKAMEDYNAAFKEEKGGILTRIGDALSGDWWGTDRLEKALRAGRNAFDRHVSAAITKIATYVELQLTAARDRVKKGRDEVEKYMTTKVTDAEREFAEGAAGTITADFDALEGEIAAAKDALVTKMVSIYKEGIERRNKREKELREANKPFWQKVWDATVGVIKKIIEFKNMLLGILARAVAVIEAIIQDPIGFLKNLIVGIAAGLNRFVGNIAENLKKALMGWLFGALEGAGLKLPEKFDLMGFLDLVLQVLGLTKENVRARAVRILGEETVVAIETAVDFIKVLFTDGPAALWQMLLEKLGDIKEVILAEIRSWVITKVIEAGIKWIIGLMNPAGAFVKACMMIYDIVVFFVERGRQIIEAVNAIINTLGAIVSGNISAMAQAVEGALNRILPVVISFLASLLGLGGISDTIRNFIEAVQKPVNAAIDWIIHQGVAIAKKIGGLFGGKKDKDKPVEKDPVDPEKQLKIDAALQDLDKAEAKEADEGGVTEDEATDVAQDTRAQHKVLSSLTAEREGDHWVYYYTASPRKKYTSKQKAIATINRAWMMENKHEIMERIHALTKANYQGRNRPQQAEFVEQMSDVKKGEVEDISVGGHERRARGFGGAGNLLFGEQRGEAGVSGHTYGELGSRLKDSETSSETVAAGVAAAMRGESVDDPDIADAAGIVMGAETSRSRGARGGGMSEVTTRLALKGLSDGNLTPEETFGNRDDDAAYRQANAERRRIMKETRERLKKGEISKEDARKQRAAASQKAHDLKRKTGGVLPETMVGFARGRRATRRYSNPDRRDPAGQLGRDADEVIDRTVELIFRTVASRDKIYKDVDELMEDIKMALKDVDDTF